MTPVQSEQLAPGSLDLTPLSLAALNKLPRVFRDFFIEVPRGAVEGVLCCKRMKDININITVSLLLL